MQAQKHAGAPTGGAAGEEAHTATALTNAKHEAFAQAIHFGEDPAEACRRIFRCKAVAASAKSTALLAEPTIIARIAALQAQASQLAEHHAHFDKAQLIAFLVETIQTPVSRIDQHHRQCQEWTRDELSATGRRPKPTAGQKTPSVPASADAQTTGKRKAASAAKSKPAHGASTISDRAGEESATASADTESAIPILIRSKTKVPSKLDAAKLLATLCGWNAPAKLEGKMNLGISPTVEDALARLLK